MSNLARNRVISQEVSSPYHPGNIVRLRNLNTLIAQCDYGAKPELIVTKNIKELAQDWKRLELEPHISVHQSFHWCDTWIEQKKIDPLFIGLKYGERIEFILPLEIKQVLGLKVAKFIGTDQSNANFALASRALIINAPSNFMEQFESLIQTQKQSIDVILLERMRPELLDLENLFLPKLKTENQNSSYQMPLLPTFAETLAQVNAKRRRKKFKNTERKLKAYCDYNYRIARSDAECEKALSSFFLQKAKRFETLGIPDVFADQNIQKFFGDLSKLPVNQVGNLELHILTVTKDNAAPEIIAVASTTQKHGHVICHFSSFDETFAEQTETSPGEFLFHLMIENAVTRGNYVFDFGIGDQAYKRSWCTVETAHYDGFISTNAIGALYALAMLQKTKLTKQIKSSKTLFKLATKLRALAAKKA